MGNQIDQLDLYQSGSMVRQRRYGGGKAITYFIKQTSGLVRTRHFGLTGNIKYHIDQRNANAMLSILGQSLVRTRKFGVSAIVWTSGVYQSQPTVGTALSVGDRGDPTKTVFGIGAAGDVVAKSVTITQKAADTPALTITRVASVLAQTAIDVKDDVGNDRFTMTISSSQIDIEAVAPHVLDGVAALNIVSPNFFTVVGLQNMIGSIDPNHAGFIYLADDQGGSLELIYVFPNILKLFDVDGFGGAIELPQMEFNPTNPPVGVRIFTDAVDGFLKVLHPDGTLTTIDDTLKARKAASESVTSSITLQDDNDIFFTGVAGATYLVDVTVIYEADAAGDISLTLTAPGDAIGGWSSTGISGNVGFNQGVAASVVMKPFTDAAVVSFGGSGAGTFSMVDLKAVVTFVTSGLFKLRWAQGTSSAVATKVKPGSRLRAERVAG